MVAVDLGSRTGKLYPRLRQPIKLGSCEIRNRIVRNAHDTGLEVDGKIGDRAIAYHRARARGGAGLLVLGVAAIHKSCAKLPGHVDRFPLYTDDCIPELARLADAVHGEGAKLFQQLWHGGAESLQLDWGFPWAPSDVTSPLLGVPVISMTTGMIDELVQAFGDAARRCKEAGLDGVEVHAAHGYLIGQFLGWASNRRTDDYGGSVLNRTLFLRRCIASARAAVGPDFTVGVRVSGSEAYADGLQSQETAQIVEILDEYAPVDFVDISMGNYFSLEKSIGAMHEALCYELPASTPVARATRAPTIVTGRIMNLHDAERIVADGIADMVSMVRALIADPDLPAKSFAGHEEDVRPCISGNQGCLGGLFNPALGHITCTVNPAIGSEVVEQFPRAAASRRVLVIGGGPAGLEAAYTAARCGHSVILCEANKELGGAINYARRAPHRADIGVIIDYLVHQIERLGVEVRLNALMDVEAVAAIAPDVVIVATGGEPRTSGRQRWRPGIEVPGMDLPHVMSPSDFLGGRVRQAKTAVVFDDIGHIAAASVAEQLLNQGCSVVFATCHACIAPQLDASLQRTSLQGRLRSYENFREFCRSSLMAVSPTAVQLCDLDSRRTIEVAAELVVVDTGIDARRDLYRELVAAGYQPQLVGDAMMPGDLQQAIATGRRVGQTLS